MVEALQIIDQESLERWLSDRPVDWARQIALRASLRVFPLVTSGWNKGSDVDKERIQGLALAVWRCLLISSVGIKNSSGNLRQAAAAAADAADAAAVAAALATGAAVDAARSAAAATARAASVFVSADVPNIAARAASSAASAGYFVRSNSVPGEIWESVHADAQFLEANGKALEEQRLWLDDVRGSEKYQANFPPWARKPFDAFAGSQLARTTSWGLIVDWYRALLPNALNNAPQSLFDEMVEVQIATQSDEFWSRKDPQAVIDDIARIAERKDPPAKPSNRIEASDYDQSRFSVIRTEKDEYWEGGKIFSYDRSRFLERGYTNTFFRDEFSNLNPITIEKLKRLPTLFTYESGTAGSSKVGKLVDIRPTESTLELKVEFDPRFTDIQSDDLANLWKKIDVFKGRIELSRTQWAIKEGNLFDLLSQLHQTANSEESVTSKEGAGLTNNIPTGRAETAYVGDNVDGSVDYLQRSEIAFALAGQLNDVWDSMNPPPSPVIPFDSAYWTGLFKRSPKQTLEPGFVVHVDAPWGGGKTTFAQYLTQILNPYRLPQLPKWLKDLPLGDAEKWKQSHRRPWHVVQFNAWQHEHVSPPWWVFYETIRKAATDAAVNETNQRWDDPPPGKSQDETNRPAEPLREFAYDGYLWMPHLRRFEFWVGETFWRLVTPKVRTSIYVTAATALALWFLVWSGIFSLNFADPSKSGISGKDLPGALAALLVVLFGGGATIRTILSSFAQSLTPGTPDAAKNYSLGAGDPLQRMRDHFLRLTRRLNRPIIVIVDDLDRCNAKFVTELVRGMQTILASPRVVYVLLGDRDWIEQAFAEVNKEMKAIDVGAEHSFGGRFVEKAIQLSMVLPAMTEEVREGYVEFLLSPDLENERAETRQDGPEGELKISSPQIKNGLAMALNAASLVAPVTLSVVGLSSAAAITEQIVSALATKKFTEREAATQKVLENIKADNFGSMSEEIRRNVGRELDFLAVGDEEAEAETRHLLLALAPALPPNPRQIKRILNTLTLNQQVMTKVYPEFRAGSTQWQQLVRWVVMAVEWPMSWFTLTRHPKLADVVLTMSAEPPDEQKVKQALEKIEGDLSQEQAIAFVKKLVDTKSVVELLTFSNPDKGWPSAPLNTETIGWLAEIMPATSGRMLKVAAKSPSDELAQHPK